MIIRLIKYDFKKKINSIKNHVWYKNNNIELLIALLKKKIIIWNQLLEIVIRLKCK